VSNLRGAATLLIRARPIEQAMVVLADLSQVDAVDRDHEVLRVATTDDPATLNHALVTAGVAVSELRYSQRSLEDVFMSLTGDRTIA
jgi:ABC-2 type transport system ATP-binding protein